MDYKISLVDMRDHAIDLKVRNLIKESYGDSKLLDEFHIHRNISLTNNINNSIFLVAHEEDEFIGCNGFIGNKFTYNGDEKYCYQSCWSATHPNHQRKGIFVNIQKKAEDILKGRDAGMIFGLPNDNSRPIFIHKLGFVEKSCNYVQLPNMGFLTDLFLNDFKGLIHPKDGLITVNEKEVYSLKKTHRSGVCEFEINKSYLWGRILHKKYLGISFNFFYVGGMKIDSLEDMRGIILQLKNLDVAYFQFSSCETNRYNELFKFWRKSSNNPFIFKFLNFPECKNIDISFGIIDVF